MATKTQPDPLPELTAPELDLMKLLWTEGRLSARELHDRLSETWAWAYSTTRTTLERMVKKGLVAKEPFHGLHLYEALISRPQGLARLVRDFTKRVLELDHAAVVPLFARAGHLTREELAELRHLLDKAERRSGR